MIKECLLICSADNPRRYSGFSKSSYSHHHHQSSSRKNKRKNNYLTTYYISKNALGALFLLFNLINMYKPLQGWMLVSSSFAKEET